jgi:hypothetical protein
MLGGLLLSVVLSVSVAHAQINVVPVNGGTGNLVSVPIPGGSGLSVTVGTGTAAIPLQDIRSNPNAVNITTWDDSYNNVPLGFDFPLYGRVFNNSWAMTNGLVTFQDPAQSGLGGACCSGIDLRTTTDPRYNYTIYGLHTDLYSWNGQNQYYLREGNSMTYGWYNVSQCCSGNGGNSFEIKINSAGLVDTRIAGARVEWNMVTSGMSGDLSKGEYYQAYHGQGLNITAGSANIFSWQALGGTGAVDMCTINPLSSPACPGYQAAYTIQQCTVSALYDPTCPGYAAAFLTQQCSSNPLFSQQCPGYQAAYLEQQCSINPLYSTTCSGYQQAYHQQQCSLNSLYATDCPGYAAAYLDQQCSINQLYSTTCPGYQQAYFNQQCTLNALYDRTCPGYSQAYATKMLLEQQNMASTVATAGVIAQTAPQTTTATVSSDGTVSSPAAVSSTGNSSVDRVISTPAPTANSAASPAAVVQLAPPPPAPAAPQQQAQQDKKPEGKPEGGDKPAGGPSQMAQNNQSSGDSKPQPTARQALQERREAAAKAKAVEDGKNLAGNMGKAADMEQQKQIQNVVIAAMGFTPGFDAYGKTTVPDAAGYKPYTVYNNQRTVDNRSALRMFGGTDKIHNEMVESQYNRGN